MWTLIKSLLAGIGKKVLGAFGSFLKSQTAELVADIKPIVVECVIAAAQADGTGRDRFVVAYRCVEAKLGEAGLLGKYKTKIINFAIEFVVNELSEQGVI